MVQCRKCKLFVSLSKDDVIKCKGTCESVYHKKCVRNIKQFMQLEICEECYKNESGSEQTSPKIDIDLNKSTVETLLGELNKKLEIIFNMQKKLEHLTETVDFYAEQYQKMTDFKKSAEKKITTLEQKNLNLYKCNRELEERIEVLEQKDKEKDIEISGLESLEDENIDEVVLKFAQKINMDVKNLEEIKRVGVFNSKINRPRPIIVTFRTKAARDDWLKQKKRRLCNNDLYKNGNMQPIYINECLTKQRRHLFWNTKIKLKSTFKYIWVQNSNILVKRSDIEKRIHTIRSENDIDKLISNIEQ